MWFHHVSFAVITCIFFVLFFFFSWPSCPISYAFLTQLLSSSPPLFSFALFTPIPFFCLFFSIYFAVMFFPSSSAFFLFCHLPFIFPLLLPSFTSFSSTFLPFLSSPLLFLFFPFSTFPPPSFSPLFIMFTSCLLLRPVRYQRQPCSACLPLKNRPRPNPALCHAGTSSKPESRERWSSLCRSDTCSSAPLPSLMMELDLQHGASPLPSDQSSPGRVCLFPGNRTLGVA